MKQSTVKHSSFGYELDSLKFDSLFPSEQRNTTSQGSTGAHNFKEKTQKNYNSKDEVKNYFQTNTEKRHHLICNKGKAGKTNKLNDITFDDEDKGETLVDESDSDYDSDLDSDSSETEGDLSSDSEEDSVYNLSSSEVTNESQSLYESSADDTEEEDDTDILKRIYEDKDGNKYEKMYESDDGNHQKFIDAVYKKYRKGRGPVPEHMSTSCEAYTDSDDDDTDTDTDNMDKIDLDDAPDTEETNDFEDESLMDPMPIPRKRPPDRHPRGIPDPYKSLDPLGWMTGKKETARCLLGSIVEHLINRKSQVPVSLTPSAQDGSVERDSPSVLQSTKSLVLPQHLLPGDFATVPTENGTPETSPSSPTQPETPEPFCSWLLPLNRINQVT